MQEAAAAAGGHLRLRCSGNGGGMHGMAGRLRGARALSLTLSAPRPCSLPAQQPPHQQH